MKLNLSNFSRMGFWYNQRNCSFNSNKIMSWAFLCGRLTNSRNRLGYACNASKSNKRYGHISHCKQLVDYRCSFSGSK